MLWHIIKFPKVKHYTCKWHKNGGHFRLNDTYIKDSCVLAKLGIDYQIDNDAPRRWERR